VAPITGGTATAAVPNPVPTSARYGQPVNLFDAEVTKQQGKSAAAAASAAGFDAFASENDNPQWMRSPGDVANPDVYAGSSSYYPDENHSIHSNMYWADEHADGNSHSNHSSSKRVSLGVYGMFA
jgi:hypothetical protein